MIHSHKGFTIRLFLERQQLARAARHDSFRVRDGFEDIQFATRKFSVLLTDVRPSLVGEADGDPVSRGDGFDHDLRNEELLIVAVPSILRVNLPCIHSSETLSMNAIHRRHFLKSVGLSAATLPFIVGLPSLGLAAPARPRQRIVFMFSPNGTIPDAYWPDEQGADFKLKEILSPLEPFKDRMLILKGLSNKVRGDGDGHMRGMSCLLTGIELFPGNIQGGSDTPAGWARGISIDQELKNYFQSREESRTRFGSLEFGVGVTDRADPWTRMSYAGPNKPVAPISDPYQMYQKLYGQMKDKESLQSILDDVQGDLKKVRKLISAEDRRMLEEHESLVKQMEREIADASRQPLRVAPPSFTEGIADQNDNLPRLSRMQIDLLVNSFVNDMARVATLQFTKSVGGATRSFCAAAILISFSICFTSD